MKRKTRIYNATLIDRIAGERAHLKGHIEKGCFVCETSGRTFELKRWIMHNVKLDGYREIEA
jgi:hypothetical protein